MAESKKCNGCGLLGTHLAYESCVIALKATLQAQSIGLNTAAIAFGREVIAISDGTNKIKQLCFLSLRRLPGEAMIISQQEVEAVPKDFKVEMREHGRGQIRISAEVPDASKPPKKTEGLLQ